jgi:hypothetical protein
MSLLLAMVSDAEACSVCFSATENTRGVYLGTTILMSLAPLLFFGFTAHMVWSRKALRPERPRSGAALS